MYILSERERRTIKYGGKAKVEFTPAELRLIAMNKVATTNQLSGHGYSFESETLPNGNVVVHIAGKYCGESNDI